MNGKDTFITTSEEKAFALANRKHLFCSRISAGQLKQKRSTIPAVHSCWRKMVAAGNPVVIEEEK